MKDLFVLVADRDIEQTIKSILNRPESLGIREISFDIMRDNNHDSGVWKTAHELLRPQRQDYGCALIIFDYHGCGQETRKAPKTSEEIESEVRERITGNSDWQVDKVLVSVLTPELEGVLWNKSPHFAKGMGYENYSAVEVFLREGKYEIGQNGKPDKPKDAMQAAMKKKQISKSSSIYGDIAKKISLKSCHHRNFLAIKDFLSHNFPT